MRKINVLIMTKMFGNQMVVTLKWLKMYIYIGYNVSETLS